MSSPVSLFLAILASITLVSCTSVPAVYDLSPGEYRGEHLSIEPWFGDYAFLFEVVNHSDVTVELLSESVVLVSPTGIARDLNSSFRARILPPGSRTQVMADGPVRFSFDPESHIRSLHSQRYDLVSQVQETESRKLERLESHRGDTFRLLVRYSVDGGWFEEIATYEIVGARSLRQTPSRAMNADWFSEGVK
jgi:hypothetical protein